MKTRILPGFLLALALAAPAHAQIAIEARAGGAVGNHAPALAGLETDPGLSLSAALEYRPLSFASLYATFSRASFGCGEGLCAGREVSMATQGFGGGVRLHPARLPWVRVGALLYGTDTHADGETGSVSPSLGYEVGGGFTLPFSDHFRMLPGLYLRSQSGEERSTLLGADVGFQVSF